MVQFTCDMCGKPLLVDEDSRYVVKIEVLAAYDPMELTDEDINKDHMSELQKLLESLSATSTEELEEGVYKLLKFDLCPPCQRKYIKDPLFRSSG